MVSFYYYLASYNAHAFFPEHSEGKHIFPFPGVLGNLAVEIGKRHPQQLSRYISEWPHPGISESSAGSLGLTVRQALVKPLMQLKQSND